MKKNYRWWWIVDSLSLDVVVVRAREQEAS